MDVGRPAVVQVRGSVQSGNKTCENGAVYLEQNLKDTSDKIGRDNE